MKIKLTCLILLTFAAFYWFGQSSTELEATRSAPVPEELSSAPDKPGVVLKRPKRIKPSVSHKPASPLKSKTEQAELDDRAEDQVIDTGWVDPPPPHVVLPPGDPSWPTELDKSVREAMAKLRECATQWRQEVPDLKGRVTMGMLVGTEGLESTELIEFDDLPEALAGCISASLFEVSWPATEEGVVHVRYPFVFVPAEESEE